MTEPKKKLSEVMTPEQVEIAAEIGELFAAKEVGLGSAGVILAALFTYIVLKRSPADDPKKMRDQLVSMIDSFLATVSNPEKTTRLH